MQSTSIEWVRNEDGTRGRTANPIRARNKKTGKVGWHCVKLSPGCANCYSGVFNIRLGTGLPFTKSSSGQVDRFVDERVLEAIRKLRKPSRIFMCDMTDLFLDEHTDAMIDQVFRTMCEARRHTFQILTKRSERMRDYFANRWTESGSVPWLRPSNVWAGVSVEDRKHGLPRIEHLRQTPAALRFLSIEPLLEDLGPIDLTGIHWVIVGGESGHGARPMHPRWVRDIRDQCVKSRIPFFFKQWGEFAPLGSTSGLDPDHHYPGRGFRESVRSGVPMDEPTSMFRVGKKHAGRVLDGHTWNEMPS